MAGTPAKRSRVKTDPELTRQLDDAHGTDTDVEAVLMLKPTKARATSADPQDARKLAEDALDRVEKQVGDTPAVVNVLTNLGMVVVAAKEPFVRKLLDQPEFVSAVSNAADDARPKAARRRATRSRKRSAS